MSRARVTIGLPVYNGEAFLAQSIESLLGQEYGEFELLISDNASTDATEMICRRYASSDARVRYERHAENIGAARNYNCLFERARGEYFRWAAADDICKPNHLRACVDGFERDRDATLVYPRTELIDARSKPIGTYDDGLDLRDDDPNKRLRQLLVNLRMCNAVFGLIRREALATTQLIGRYIASDQVLLVELALRGKFVELDAPLFLRRLHDGGSQFAHATPADLAEWFAPENRERRTAPRTRLWTEILTAISRAPLSPTERLRCLWTIHRHWMPRHWRAIGGELKHQLRGSVSRRAS